MIVNRRTETQLQMGENLAIEWLTLYLLVAQICRQHIILIWYKT